MAAINEKPDFSTLSPPSSDSATRQPAYPSVQRTDDEARTSLPAILESDDPATPPPAFSEKTTFSLSPTRSGQDQCRPSFESVVSVPEGDDDLETNSTAVPSPAHATNNPYGGHPLSVFYSHPTTKTSLEQLRNSNPSWLQKGGHTIVQTVSAQSDDLEAQITRDELNTDRRCGLTRTGTTVSVGGGPKKGCTVWPCPKEMRARAQQMKQQRTCRPLRNLDRRTRILVQILLAILIVGAATGLGIGISKALRTGVWQTQTEQKSLTR